MSGDWASELDHSAKRDRSKGDARGLVLIEADMCLGEELDAERGDERQGRVERRWEIAGDGLASSCWR